MRKLFSALLLIVPMLAFTQEFQKPTNPALQNVAAPIFIDGKGERIFHKGPMGTLSRQGDAAALLDAFTPLMDGRTSLAETRDKTDKLGKRHVRVQQFVNGRAVVGSDMIVHADSEGNVYAINGRFVNTDDAANNPSINGRRAMANGMNMANIRKGIVTGQPQLTYVADQDGQAFLAWSAMVTYEDAQGPQRDLLFADATGAERFVRHPQHHYAKNRRTYDGNNGSSLPGTLARTEGSGNTGDGPVDAAHNNAGITYDYYNTKFGRDSYNNSGATLSSTAHHQNSYNNAFWNGSQMVYGDGDGTTFSPLSESLDVVAHELSHAVTSSESNLVYSYESGALNEAFSDIMGAAAEAWDDGSISTDTWLLGEDIYTPAISGDALRTMADPQASGDYDYYPTRYMGSGDNGGVHTNSGIANLAFVLLVQGGTHPRGTTSNSVPAIGMSKAEQIFYRANTTYLTSSSNFEDMRNATASAANDLYGATEVAAIHEAWDAVGVPGGSGGGSCSNTTYTGSISSGGQSFEPNGTYFYGNGSNSGVLSGTASDLDLYLWKWNGSWGTVAQSTSANSNESISYSGTSGYYVWRVHAYSGSGTYNLCANP